MESSSSLENLGLGKSKRGFTGEKIAVNRLILVIISSP
jgi:hypothetical protein